MRERVVEKQGIERLRAQGWRPMFVPLVAAVLSLAPVLGAAECKIKSLELPISMENARAVAKLGINGTEIPMILDSGAFHSSLSHAAAAQLGLQVRRLPQGYTIFGLTGKIPSGMTVVKQLNLLKGTLPNVEFLVGGNDDNTGTMGLLGRNILSVADTEYDLAHGVVRLMFPSKDCDGMNMAYWAGETPISEVDLEWQSSSQPDIRASAALNGKKLRVMLDTGAQSLVSLAAAKRAGLSNLQPAGKVRGAGYGEADAWTAKAERFELGDESISNVRLAVVDFSSDVDMLLGVDFFLSHRIYVSKKQQRMYFTYNGGTVFALNAIDLEEKRATATGEPAAAGPQLPALPDAAAHARRGAASAARMDFLRALADLDRACEMAPQEAEHFVRRGTVHATMRNASLALKDFATALQLDPLQPEALLRRAQIHAAVPDRAAAIEDLQALDRSLPPQAPQRFQMAGLFTELGLFAQAVPQWDQWIAARPHDTLRGEAFNARCWLRVLQNVELEAALDDCDRAIDLDARQAPHHDSRAWLRLRPGQWPTAFAH